MKKNVLSVLVAVLSVSTMVAQEVKESKVDQSSGFNHWSVDVNSGFTKPFSHFTKGYYVDNFSFIHVDLGVRYMFNNKAGLKVDFGYDGFKGGDNSLKDFKGKYMRTNIQGVVNVGRVLNFEDWTRRLGVLVHAGPGYAWMTNDAFSGKDNMANVLAGITGQIRLTDKITLNGDITGIKNWDQSRTFDGGTKIKDKHFNGILMDASIGLTVSLGKNKKHADWYVGGPGLGSDDAKDKLAALQNKVSDLEAKMVDTDGDGVIDALDEEKESAKGAIVDTKGRNTDLNNNGIADSVDKVIAATKSDIKTTAPVAAAPAIPASGETAKNLINDGYIVAYFNLGDATPLSTSTEGIGFVLTYLRNNPAATVDIIGKTDETGTEQMNAQLATKRAQNVKDILVKAGIAPARMNVVSKGEDKSVDVKSSEARSLVRKVIFMIK